MKDEKLRKLTMLVLIVELILIPVAAYLKINYIGGLLCAIVWGFCAFFFALSIVLIAVWIAMSLKKEIRN